MSRVQRKAFAFELKSTAEDGTFTGFASVYGVKDLQGDVVDKGAFTKSLQERGAEVPILWQHDPTTPIGKGTLTDTPQGLKITGKLSLGVTKAKDAYELLKDEVVTGLSIGYDVVKQKYDAGVRHLQELKLFEISTVTFPANEDALVASVKAVDLASFDVKSLNLPESTAALLTGLLQKAASYQDRIAEAYEAVRAAFPLVCAWVEDVSDDAIVVCVDGDYYQIAVTAWSEANVPTLGAVLSGDYVFVPDGGALSVSPATDVKALRTKAAAARAEAKSGARHSAKDQKAIQAAHDAIVEAGAKCMDEKAAPSPSGSKADDNEVIEALRNNIAVMRPPAA